MITPPIIQGSEAHPQRAPLASAVPVFVTVFLIVVIISTVITFILPEVYASTVRIAVEPDARPGSGQLASYDPYFLQTEFEVIQSQLVLNPVIEKLDLNAEWGEKYSAGKTLDAAQTLKILKQRLELRPVRGTKLVAITVYSDDRKEAARIANAVADSYWAYRVAEAGKTDAQSQTNPPVHVDKFGTAGQKQEELERTLPVVIVDRAAPGRKPARPNKPLNITLGAVAGLGLGMFAATLVRAFKSRL